MIITNQKPPSHILLPPPTPKNPRPTTRHPPSETFRIPNFTLYSQLSPALLSRVPAAPPRQNPPLAATQNEDHHIAEIPIESSSAASSTHEPTHIEPTQRETTYELTYPVVASAKPAYVAAASTEDTHPAPTNPEDTYSVSNHSEKPRLLKSSKSKRRISNNCCRWDIPNMSTIKFLSLEKEGTRQTLIIQNKPNFEKKQNELTPFLITTNSQKPPTRTAKNKPNTNPIQTHSKPIQTLFEPITDPSKANFRTAPNACSRFPVAARSNNRCKNRDGSCKYLPINDNLDFDTVHFTAGAICQISLLT